VPCYQNTKALSRKKMKKMKINEKIEMRYGRNGKKIAAGKG
jgi:hypothetical protein